MASFVDGEVPPFDTSVHLFCPEPTDEQQRAINEFRQALEEVDLYHQHREWADDRQLLRFLIARNFNQKASFDMIVEALKWREKRQPSRIESQSGWEEKMSKESETGKIYCPGHDRWGRSLLVFDNTVQNTPHVDDHMLFLAWNLEFAIKMMTLSPAISAKREREANGLPSGGPVPDKYTIFMHLTNFSFFNTPPLQSTRETIHMVATCFPERLGHCIAYQPPAVFKVFFNTVKGFLDPKTANKMVFVIGDVSEGSENDLLMKRLIGDNWKTLTGAEQEVVRRGNSPGYNHEKFWPTVRKRLDQYEQESGKNSQSPSGTSSTSSSQKADTSSTGTQTVGW